MRFSIVIPTYNRASDLRETLGSLANLRPTGSWEVIVVDNNSRDSTREVVAEAALTFPVALRYLFEGEQGRSAALNAGIQAASGEIILCTDDDVRVADDWVNRAAEALDKFNCTYVGGKVLPMWNGPQPRWLPARGAQHYARVLAILDYGPDPIEFGKRVPLGVNMAFRREAFASAGLWDNRVGRKAGTLLGQEVREWVIRAQSAGLRGFYAPAMVVQHVIPRERLNKRYFRRWFYWNGISRAMLYKGARLDMDRSSRATQDSAAASQMAGVPTYMYRRLVRSLLGLVKASASGNAAAAFESELYFWFFAGVIRQRWRDRTYPVAAADASAGS
jgi:glucosyl-dolichyl phosphate glucuronosyltransferase